jgi:hypothetical protein
VLLGYTQTTFTVTSLRSTTPALVHHPPSQAVQRAAASSPSAGHIPTQRKLTPSPHIGIELNRLQARMTSSSEVKPQGIHRFTSIHHLRLHLAQPTSPSRELHQPQNHPLTSIDQHDVRTPHSPADPYTTRSYQTHTQTLPLTLPLLGLCPPSYIHACTVCPLGL